MKLKKRFNIQILEQEISVLSDSGDEHVTKTVRYVNNKAKEIESASGNISSLNVAILVALNIADELFKFKKEKEDAYNQLESRTERLINWIEETKHTIPCDVRD